MPASEIVATLIKDFPLTLLAGMICGAMCAYAGFLLQKESTPLVGISLSQIAVAGVAVSYIRWMPSDSLQSSLLLTFGAAMFLASWKAEGEARNRILLLIFVLALMVRMITMSRSTQDANFEIETVLKGYVWFVKPSVFYVVLGCASLTLLHAVLQKTSFATPLGTKEGTSSPLWSWTKLTFYATIALIIAVSVHSAGDIFVLGFLLLPPMIASIMSHKNSHRFVLSILIGLLAPIGGLFTAFRYDVPPGASSVAVATLFFLAVWLLGKFRSLISVHS
ncbi:MAG: metal ABC transporter permease [Bacteroidota bacterium]